LNEVRTVTSIDKLVNERCEPKVLLGFHWSEPAAVPAQQFIFDRRAVLHSSEGEESSKKIDAVGLLRILRSQAIWRPSGLNRFDGEHSWVDKYMSELLVTPTARY
jgi:hypothetical protein